MLSRIGFGGIELPVILGFDLHYGTAFRGNREIKISDRYVIAREYKIC